MSQFKFNKRIPEHITKSIGQLEELFHHLIRQIIYFQEKLDRQSGKAASALKRNLNHHLQLMSKSAPILLNFADVMKSFMLMVESTDQGGSTFIMSTGRAEWQYSLSSERIEKEIKLDSKTMKGAALSFQNNVANIDELFAEFNTMLNEVISETQLPWDDFTSVWSEAHDRVKSITEETKKHIEKLTKETERFVQELNRLDHMAAQQKIVV